jgi:hypothetical protein
MKKVRNFYDASGKMVKDPSRAVRVEVLTVSESNSVERIDYYELEAPKAKRMFSDITSRLKD